MPSLFTGKCLFTGERNHADRLADQKYMKFTDAGKAADWIMSRRNREHGFAHFQEAMEAAGNPQNTLHAIHVAGTNGKGSTTNYISDMLIACGYQVGTFTSPHLVEHRDRIKINQE